MKSKIINWIKQQVKAAKTQGCVFGLSGGVDSAVVGALCKQAFPDNVLGFIMPCFSNPDDQAHAEALAKKLVIPTKLIDLSASFSMIYHQLEGKAYDGTQMNLAIANLKPRLRMLALYYHANKQNYLVVGTGNKSEAVMGYYTKYGDGGVDILPLGGLLKTQVRALAKELGIPAEIISKPPSAGLWSGQTDEGEMGLTYAALDKIITSLEKKKPQGLDTKLVTKVKQKLAENAHKRCAPPFFRP